MSKFQDNPRTSGLQIWILHESNFKIQNFGSIGALKLFLWPFENRRFRLKTYSVKIKLLKKSKKWVKGQFHFEQKNLPRLLKISK